MVNGVQEVATDTVVTCHQIHLKLAFNSGSGELSTEKTKH